MSKSHSRIILGVCAVILLAGLGIFAAFMLRKPLVAFYRIPEQHIPAIQAAFGENVLFKLYDNNVSLYSQVREGRKPDIIITSSGQPLKNAESMAAKNVSLSDSLFSNITTSIRTTVAKPQDEGFTALPLLSSHFEIDINVRKMRRTTVKNINTWNDIARFIKESKKQNDDVGMVFAGRDGEVILDFLSALTEAFEGHATYNKAVSIIQDMLQENAQKQRNFNADDIAERLAKTPDTPLFTAVEFVKKWLKEGLIYPDSFNINKKSLGTFMENNMASVVVMSLADHRNIAHNAIEPFTSIYFPSDITPDSRHFVAPIFYAVPFTNNKKALLKMENLIAVETQETLTRATGLAPVLARCRTPDKQADDARYWVAATNTPLPGLSRETTLSDDQLHALGVALTALIRR